MSYTLLHDQNNAFSEAFLPIFGVSGQVLSGQDVCKGYMPNFQGFPTVVYEDSQGTKHAFFDPKDMETVMKMASDIEMKIFEGVPLNVLKERFVKRVREASDSVRFSLNSTAKEIDIRRLAPGFTQEHLDHLNVVVDSINAISNQAATEIEQAVDHQSLADIVSEYEAVYGSEVGSA